MQVHRYHFIALTLLLLLGMPSSLLGQSGIGPIAPLGEKGEKAFCYRRVYNLRTGELLSETKKESCAEIYLFNGYVPHTGHGHFVGPAGGHIHDSTGRTKGQKYPKNNRDSTKPDSISVLMSTTQAFDREGVDPGPYFQGLGTAKVGSYKNTKGFPYKIAASHVGQREWITICDGAPIPPNALNCTTYYFDVKQSGLSNFRKTIQGNPNMVDIGYLHVPAHPDNHYGTTRLRKAITRIVRQYHNEFSCHENDIIKDGSIVSRKYQAIGINDMSLPYGGIFDVRLNWRGPHYTHSHGNSVDIRLKHPRFPNSSNSIIYDEDVIRRFREICREGDETNSLPQADRQEEYINTSNEHIHCSTSSSGR